MTKDDSGDNLLDHARCEIFLVHPDVADGVASEIPSPGSLVKCPILAQLLAVSRNAACTAVSSALRNRNPSLLVSEAGTRVIAPSSRKCRAISRPASALPIFASVHCFPVGETTRAPLWRQRDASGISDVTQTSAAEMCSGIQSSAASAVADENHAHVRDPRRPDGA
jgi:hypothetical protein